MACYMPIIKMMSCENNKKSTNKLDIIYKCPFESF